MTRISVGTYLLNLVKFFLDVLFNVVVIGLVRIFVPMSPACGNVHYTVSEALDELRSAGVGAACALCKALSIVFKPFNPGVKNYDHCDQSMVGMPEDISSS